MAQDAVAVVLHLDAEISANVDRDRMIQVVTNLLSNAIKFSLAGDVVDLYVQRQSRQVRMSVVDQGCGIPHAFREHMFQKFAQADSTDSRQKGGTGLGLSICKRIVEEHGGTITYVSEEGNGSTFHVDLPSAEDEGQKVCAEHKWKIWIIFRFAMTRYVSSHPNWLFPAWPN